MILLYWIALVLVLLSCGGILLIINWRWIIGLLALQVLGTFILTLSEWSISLASVILVAGWMACAILAMAHGNMEGDSGELTEYWTQGRLFRLALVGILVVVSFIGGVTLNDWLGMSFPAAWGSLLLISMGLVNLGVSSLPFRVIIGLLTTLNGFEVVYAAVERSALVVGLQVVISLGLALSGAYLMMLPSSKEHP